MADYYSTLGISKDASPDDIKRAYRKLASQHHPDKGGDKEKFQEIQAAYATLSDTEKRAQYDNPQPQFGGGFPPGFEDIFSAFGNGHPFGDIFGRRQQPQRNKTLNIQTRISLEEAYHGKELIASVTLPSGRDQLIEIKIPAGIHDNTTLRLAGLGDDTFQNIPRGDIQLTIGIHPHMTFQRQGDDLIRNIEISCIDAMVGKSIEVDTIDGRTLEVKINAGTQPENIIAAQGYGMPNVNDTRFKGRMLLNVKMTVPPINDEQKEALKKLFT
jgi:DnaJ-class molecular chaperone